MFHFCIFGGHVGQLSAAKKVYVTVFGSCDLKRQTLAKRIIEKHQRSVAGLTTRRAHFFVTIFGGTEITAPTLAEEFVDLREALRSGVLSADVWESAVAQIELDDAVGTGSFTLFGGFESDSLPDENAEVDGLALNRHLGQIDENTGKLLEMGVGQGGAQRAAVLRQAVASSIGPPKTTAQIAFTGA